MSSFTVVYKSTEYVDPLGRHVWVPLIPDNMPDELASQLIIPWPQPSLDDQDLKIMDRIAKKYGLLESTDGSKTDTDQRGTSEKPVTPD